MAISNFTELKTAIGTWLDRTDISDVATDLIKICESDLNSRIRARCMRAHSTITPSQVYDYVDLPSRFLEVISFTTDTGSQVKRVGMDEIQNRRYCASAGRPAFFDITSRIEFDKVSDGAYAFVLYYYKSLDIATDTTNDILSKYPNVYLYGSLLAAAPYLKQTDQLQVWVTLYNQGIDQVNNTENRDYKPAQFELPFGDADSYMFDINRGY